MVEIIKAVTELISAVGNIGLSGIAALSLIVAFTTIWILGRK